MNKEQFLKLVNSMRDDQITEAIDLLFGRDEEQQRGFCPSEFGMQNDKDICRESMDCDDCWEKALRDE